MFKRCGLPVFTLLFTANLFAQTFTAPGGIIPDDGTIIAYDLPVSGLQPTINAVNFGLVNVCFSLVHTWNADLAVSLRAPDGTTIPLFSNIGGDTDGFVNCCLSGNVSESIYAGTYPYTGTFRPFGDMGALNNGQNPNGVWQLVILDTYAFADAGELFDWSITFGTNPCKPFPFESSDLPIVVINTGGQPIVDEPKIDAQLRLIDNGPGQRNFVLQPTAAYEGPVGVEIHGNSAQGFPKKSYNLETRDTAGEDLEVSLLGLPNASDFVLTANFSDKTLMRNALTYELARRTGQYATRTRFCEVVIDHTYQGVYALTEKIKRGKNRVDVSKLTESDTLGKALTGGYIVKVDWNDSPGWNSPFSQPNSPTIFTYFQHEYPKPENILPVQHDYIQAYVDSFEVALQGPDFQDTAIGWRHFAEEKSFLDYLFINELSKNVDGYRLSTYFHKDKGEKMAMGPLWDFDLAWYNADYCEGFNITGWAYNINYVCGDAGVPFWWERLFEDTAFTQNAACYWQTMRAGTLHRDSIFATIDSMAAVVEEAQQRNFLYWPILGVYVWPNPGALPTTYAGEVLKMKTWISSRLNWLDFAFGDYAPTLNADFAATSNSALDWQFTGPAAGNLQYAWDFDDGTTSTGAAPQHHFPGPGTYHVRLTLSTAFGCEATSEQIIHIVNTGTQDVAVGNLQVYPNPTAGNLQVTLPGELEGPFRVQLTNSLGELVLSREFVEVEKSVSLALTDLPAGVYAVELHSRLGRWLTRVLVEKG